MKINDSYNTVVIGSGPGGLFAMLELAKNNIKCLLVEKDKMLGGMAFNTDVNLQDYEGLPPLSNLGKRLFKSNEIANDLIAKVFNTFRHYGLSEKIIKDSSRSDKLLNQSLGEKYQHVEHKTLPIKYSLMQKIVSNIHQDLDSNKNSQVIIGSEVQSVKKGSQGKWKIVVKQSSGKILNITTDNVIFATGKLSVLWLLDTLSSIGVGYKENQLACLGVRLEEKASRLSKITARSLNPKIRIFGSNYQAETFCWCANGGVMSYDFYGSKILDGMHLHERPSKNTSFGLMVTLQLPKGVSSVSFSLAFARLMNSLGNGEITLQRLEDFKKGINTTKESLKNNSVKPSLKNFQLVNMKAYISQAVADGIISLIDKINEMYGNVLSKDCLIYAPIIERIFPLIKIDSNMQTEKRGIFLVGDCSGKSIGVIPATTMGIQAARFIINNKRI